MHLKDQLNRLPHFIAVCEAGSIHQAARQINLAQPSLSHSIKTFEENLGYKLFDRRHSGMKLTRAGIVVREFAMTVLDQARRTDGLLSAPYDPMAGAITIGTYDIFAVHFWPRLMANFQRALPQLKLSLNINVANSHHLRQIKEGQTQVAILVEPAYNSSLRVIELFQERYGFYASKSYLRQKSISIETLKQHPIIAFGSAISGANSTLGQLLQGLGLSENISHNLDSFDAVMSFTRHGLGIAILPTIMVEKVIKSRALVPLSIRGLGAKKMPSQRVCLCYPTSVDDDAKVMALGRAIRREFSSLS